jgi:hypothetical protein
MATIPAVALDPDTLYEIVDGQLEEKAMPGARHGSVFALLRAQAETLVSLTDRAWPWNILARYS